jgi:hypothetical protein
MKNVLGQEKEELYDRTYPNHISERSFIDAVYTIEPRN